MGPVQVRAGHAGLTDDEEKAPVLADSSGGGQLDLMSKSRARLDEDEVVIRQGIGDYGEGQRHGPRSRTAPMWHQCVMPRYAGHNRHGSSFGSQRAVRRLFPPGSSSAPVPRARRDLAERSGMPRASHRATAGSRRHSRRHAVETPDAVTVDRAKRGLRDVGNNQSTASVVRVLPQGDYNI
jgi:hypothetical protein